MPPCGVKINGVEAFLPRQQHKEADVRRIGHPQQDDRCGDPFRVRWLDAVDELQCERPVGQRPAPFVAWGPDLPGGYGGLGGWRLAGIRKSRIQRVLEQVERKGLEPSTPSLQS